MESTLKMHNSVWETTARQLAKGEWKFRVASNIHFILAGLASNSCKASRNYREIDVGKIMWGRVCILNFSVDRNEVS
jgi:hypothetical protein